MRISEKVMQAFFIFLFFLIWKKFISWVDKQRILHLPTFNFDGSSIFSNLAIVQCSVILRNGKIMDTYLVQLNCQHRLLGDSVPRSSPWKRPDPYTWTSVLYIYQSPSVIWTPAGSRHWVGTGYLEVKYSESIYVCKCIKDRYTGDQMVGECSTRGEWGQVYRDLDPCRFKALGRDRIPKSKTIKTFKCTVYMQIYHRPLYRRSKG